MPIQSTTMQHLNQISFQCNGPSKTSPLFCLLFMKNPTLLQWPNSLVSVFSYPSNSYYYLTLRVFNVDDDISVQFFFMNGIYAAQCLIGF